MSSASDPLLNARMAGRTLSEFARRIRGDDPQSVRLRLALNGLSKTLATCTDVPSIDQSIAILALMVEELERTS